MNVAKAQCVAVGCKRRRSMLAKFRGGTAELQIEAGRWRGAYIYISINQSMALSASCAGHTRTQSHAALYKINNEVVHSGMMASDYKHVGLSECEVMDDTWYV